jgi:hypothetical protein
MGTIGGLLPILVRIAVIVALGFAIVWAWKRVQITRSKRIPRTFNDPTRRRIFAAYRRLLKQRKITPQPGMTVHEQIGDDPALAEMAKIVEEAAYRPRAEVDSLWGRLKSWLNRKTTP